MRLFVDESAARELESELRARGVEASHVETLQLAGSADPVLFDYALDNGYDAIVTRDRYSQPLEHLAAFRAMRDGLRIIELRFRGTALRNASRAGQVDLVVSNLDEIERAVDPDSDIRHLVLNGRTRAVSRRLHAADVEAELEQLERKSRLDSAEHEDGGGR